MAKRRAVKKQRGKNPSTVKRRKGLAPTPPVNRLLLLPREIRDEIYRQFGLPMHRQLEFRGQVQERFHRGPDTKAWSPSAPLFQLCHQIRSEAVDFVCSRNIFVFDIPCEISFSALGPILQRIRFLELNWVSYSPGLRDVRELEQLGRELIDQASSLQQLTITSVSCGKGHLKSPQGSYEDTSMRMFLEAITKLKSLQVVRLAGFGANIAPEIDAQKLSLNTRKRIEDICFGFDGFHSRCIGLDESAREFATAKPHISSKGLHEQTRRPSNPGIWLPNFVSRRSYLTYDLCDFLGFRFREHSMRLHHRIRVFNESTQGGLGSTC